MKYRLRKRTLGICLAVLVLMSAWPAYSSVAGFQSVTSEPISLESVRLLPAEDEGSGQNEEWNGNGSGAIAVTKDIKTDGTIDLQSIDTEIYFALTKRDTEGYVRDQNGNMMVRKITVANGVPSPSQVQFTGLTAGNYEVWELYKRNGVYARQYVGLAFDSGSGASFQLGRIRGSSPDGGNNAIVSDGETVAVSMENTYTRKKQTIDFVAKKEWVNRQMQKIDPPRNAGIVFTVYNNSNEEIRSIVLNGAVDGDGEFESWVATFENLPFQDANGREIQYKVRETVTVPNFFPCKDPNSIMGENDYLQNNGGTIYNRQLLINIKIEKHFDIQENRYSDAEWNELISSGRLRFVLTNDDTGQEWIYSISPDGGFTRDNQTFRRVLEGMPYGHYTIREYGYRGLIQERKWTPDGSWTVYENEETVRTNMDNPQMDMLLENHYIMGEDHSEGAYVSVLKQWDDVDNFDGIRPASIQVELLANGIRAERVENPVTLNPGNNWRTSWEELPETDGNGQPIDYTVRELSVPQGYTATYSVTGAMDKAYTITNHHTPEGSGTLVLKKTVSAPEEMAAPASYWFTVRDQSTGKYVDPSGALQDAPIAIEVEITGNGTGARTIRPVPVGTYTVAENRDFAQADHYTLTVTGEGDYTVRKDRTTTAEITNAYEEETEKGYGLLIVHKTIQIDGVTITKSNMASYASQFSGKKFSYVIQYQNGQYLQRGAQWNPEEQKNVGFVLDHPYVFTETLVNPYDNHVIQQDIRVPDYWNEYPVPAGRYTLIENEEQAKLNGYTLTVNASPAVVRADGTACLEVTNVYSSGTDTGSLTVKKVTDPAGIADEKAYKVTIRNSEGQYLQEDLETFGAAPAELDVSVNTPLTVSDLPVGDYNVTEITDGGKAQVSGYSLTSTACWPANGAVTVAKDAQATVTVTNTYAQEQRFASVDLTKLTAGNMLNHSTAFPFGISVLADGQNYTDYTVTVKSGTPDVNSPSAPQLKHSDIITIGHLPVGAQVTITETDNLGAATTASGIAGGQQTGLSYSFTVPENGGSVTFTNELSLILDTGVRMDTAPYQMLLGIALLALALMGRKKKRRT